MSEDRKNDVLIDLQERLRRIDAVNRRLGGPRRFTILGAGISGLVAAYELVRRGHEVDLIEGSRRVGGRIFTARLGPQDVPEEKRPYVELGAMRIPKDHSYTRYYAQDVLGLELRPFLNNDLEGNGSYDLRGVLGQVKTFAGTYVDGLSPVFRLSPLERSLVRTKGPAGVLGPRLELLLDRLTDEEADLLVRGLFTTPYLRALDAISLQQLLQEGRPEWGVEPLSPGALELLGTGGYLEGIWDRSLSFFVRDELTVDASKLDYIDGGLDRLPRGLADRLAASGRCHLSFGTRVERLAVQPDGSDSVIEVRLSSGDTLVLPFVLCTLPFSVLRQLDLQGLSNGKMSAIRNWSYVSSTKVGIYFKERFWETEYGIYGGRSVTDHLTTQLYYPNDFRVAALEAEMEAYSQEVGRVSLAALPHTPPAAVVPEALLEAAGSGKKPIPDRTDGVLLTSYNWGLNAIRMAALSREERVAKTLADIARFHPDVSDYAVPEDSASMAWDQYPWAAGAFSMPRQHDIELHYSDALAPERGLFFCGEHLSPVPAWIQGAMASGLYALEQMMEHAVRVQEHRVQEVGVAAVAD